MMTPTRTRPSNSAALISRKARQHRRRTSVLATAAAAALALTACSTTADGAEGKGRKESAPVAESELSPVLLLGDSVAAGQAVALRQGLAESGETFVDETSTGGGNVVGPNSAKQWKALPKKLEQAEHGVVLYQVATYDWGTPKEQRAAYERLAGTVSDLDADLIFVSMPPIQADEFYEPHLEELESANKVARAVAQDADNVEYLDATAVWGKEYARERAGEIDRSEDGIHTCPQGAARFAGWILDQLSVQYPDFTPAAPEQWANTGWSSSDVFRGC